MRPAARPAVGPSPLPAPAPCPSVRPCGRSCRARALDAFSSRAPPVAPRQHPLWFSRFIAAFDSPTKPDRRALQPPTGVPQTGLAPPKPILGVVVVVTVAAAALRHRDLRTLGRYIQPGWLTGTRQWLLAKPTARSLLATFIWQLRRDDEQRRSASLASLGRGAERLTLKLCQAQLAARKVAHRRPSRLQKGARAASSASAPSSARNQPAGRRSQPARRQLSPFAARAGKSCYGSAPLSCSRPAAADPALEPPGPAQPTWRPPPRGPTADVDNKWRPVAISTRCEAIELCKLV